jgi:hypothetical protein
MSAAFPKGFYRCGFPHWSVTAGPPRPLTPVCRQCRPALDLTAIVLAASNCRYLTTWFVGLKQLQTRTAICRFRLQCLMSTSGMFGSLYLKVKIKQNIILLNLLPQKFKSKINEFSKFYDASFFPERQLFRQYQLF